MQVARAYKTLTDPVAKENFEKFGNPDGRQSLAVRGVEARLGAALPCIFGAWHWYFVVVGCWDMHVTSHSRTPGCVGVVGTGLRG